MQSQMTITITIDHDENLGVTAEILNHWVVASLAKDLRLAFAHTATHEGRNASCTLNGQGVSSFLRSAFVESRGTVPPLPDFIVGEVTPQG